VSLEVLLILIVVGGGAASQVWLGLAKGKVATRYGFTDRAKNPTYFWAMFAVWSVMAFVLLADAFLFGIAFGIRWSG
jgi:hypothetical protein